MKEVMAIIRLNMIGATKDALLRGGFPSVTCAKVMGRGKAKVDFALVTPELMDGQPETRYVEQFSEGYRLLPKRLLSLIVRDEEAPKVVEVIMAANHTGNPGDGKVFILPVTEAVQVRTGQRDEAAI